MREFAFNQFSYFSEFFLFNGKFYTLQMQSAFELKFCLYEFNFSHNFVFSNIEEIINKIYKIKKENFLRMKSQLKLQNV